MRDITQTRAGEHLSSVRRSLERRLQLQQNTAVGGFCLGIVVCSGSAPQVLIETVMAWPAPRLSQSKWKDCAAKPTEVTIHEEGDIPQLALFGSSELRIGPELFIASRRLGRPQ